jgi:hypothetical protein
LLFYIFIIKIDGAFYFALKNSNNYLYFESNYFFNNFGVIGSSIATESSNGKSFKKNNTFIENIGFAWSGTQLSMGNSFTSISGKDYLAIFQSNKFLNNWSEYWGSIIAYQTYLILINCFYYGWLLLKSI